MKNFSQSIIAYHGCGTCYLDGTNAVAKFGCSNATFNPFWKRPVDLNKNYKNQQDHKLKLNHMKQENMEKSI